MWCAASAKRPTRSNLRVPHVLTAMTVTTVGLGAVVLGTVVETVALGIGATSW